MARRGLLAALVHAGHVAARENARAQRFAVREHNASVRRAAAAQRSAEALVARLARASQADRKQLEREAREAHVAAREAEVEERNLKLEEINGDLDSLLVSTLGVDDYVELEALRAVVKHPPFSRPELETPVSRPEPIVDPPRPAFDAPPPPQGLVANLFGKKRYADLLAEAREVHERALAKWKAKVDELPAQREQLWNQHSRAEAARIQALDLAREEYANECKGRVAEAEERNRQLDTLIANLAYGVREAVQEYISIVLANSSYPEHFPVSYEFGFEPTSAELTLRVLVPGPDAISQVKAYKYSKSSDEIVETSLSQKACRDRYSSAIHQVALRSIHEVFEADRRGLIKTISLELGTNTIDPATGNAAYVPFVAVGAARESFMTFDLSAVVPALTLARLGASISKNPYALVAAETSGIRRS